MCGPPDREGLCAGACRSEWDKCALKERLSDNTETVTTPVTSVKKKNLSLGWPFTFSPSDRIPHSCFSQSSRLKLLRAGLKSSVYIVITEWFEGSTVLQLSQPTKCSFWTVISWGREICIADGNWSDALQCAHFSQFKSKAIYGLLGCPDNQWKVNTAYNSLNVWIHILVGVIFSEDNTWKLVLLNMGFALKEKHICHEENEFQHRLLTDRMNIHRM